MLRVWFCSVQFAISTPADDCTSPLRNQYGRTRTHPGRYACHRKHAQARDLRSQESKRTTGRSRDGTWCLPRSTMARTRIRVLGFLSWRVELQHVRPSTGLLDEWWS
ncbi:hypothetical protein BU23DRAFT_559195 [Bimuria novae-zelandiae CBS 107.79]|uniref:Uncharacterized protein n=1 Tax=Bimuria novae-zelandiae CBS 107.79 TaxID=1447943 RepID=A0A6A5V334_9PLEO|nr:hypothetical protein BU23DRAFT_559195 [Bimuria novae-zelandiae CBS 107.79]